MRKFDDRNANMDINVKFLILSLLTFFTEHYSLGSRRRSQRCAKYTGPGPEEARSEVE